WYTGAFMSTVKTAGYRESRGVQAIAYAGYAWRKSSQLSFDAGADYVVVTAAPRYDYPEVHAGFSFQNVSGRLYYSPRYFGQDASAIYAEVNVAQPVLENMRLLAHVGALGGPASRRYGNTSDPLFDGAAGIAIDWRQLLLQVSWAGVSHRSGAYLVTGMD